MNGRGWGKEGRKEGIGRRTDGRACMDVVLLLLHVKKNPSSSSPIDLRALLRTKRTNANPSSPPPPCLPPPSLRLSSVHPPLFSTRSPPRLFLLRRPYYSTRRRYKPLFSLCGERRGGGERESAPSDEKTEELRSRGEKGDKRERKKGGTPTRVHGVGQRQTGLFR